MSEAKQERLQVQATTSTAATDDFSALMQRPITFTPFAESKEITLTGAQVRKFIAKPTRKGVQPSDGDIVQFLKLCEARQLNPWVGDAFLVGYDSQDGAVFTCIASHQSLMKRAEANPNFDGMQQGVIVSHQDGSIRELEGDFVPTGCKLVGGWARVYRKDRKVPFYDSINLESRDKNRSQWTADKSGMIVKCAEASALRMAFPSQLSGLYISQEMAERHYDKPSTAEVVKPRTLEELTARLRPQTEETQPQLGDAAEVGET